MVHPDGEPSSAARVVLAQEGFNVACVESFASITRAVLEHRPSLILFDVERWHQLLGDALNELADRKSTRDIRKVVLSKSVDAPAMILALDLGADDFLIRPISARELLARLQAVLRSLRPVTGEEDCQALGAMNLYREGMEVAIDGSRVKLSPTEFNLLAFMMDHSGHVLSREELLENLWLPCKEIEERRVVDVYVHRLREKIEHDPSKPQWLITRRREGYSLVDPSTQDKVRP